VIHHEKANFVLDSKVWLNVGDKRKSLNLVLYGPKKSKPKEIEKANSAAEIKVYHC